LVDPSSSSGQASPAYIYIQVLKQLNLKKNSKCVGSTFKPYFDMLNKTGTPTMETAAYEPNCGWLWGEYDNPQKSYPCDKNFKIGNPLKIDVKTDLTALKYWLSQDHALAYGTSLGDNWSSYRGETVPYITHTKKKGKDGKLAGHCMLIIGYDDNIGDGAVLIQNSEGTAWGSDGYVWMAYKTFQWLAQGDAFYVE
jgi:C1A family cysteine protease